MPRGTRFDLVGITQHIIQRGNDRHACFFCGEDYQAYLRWLDEGARRYECREKMGSELICRRSER